jgi:hypothetical protein
VIPDRSIGRASTACPSAFGTGRGAEMNKNVTMVIFFVLMIACIVGADVTFLRNHLVARLIANIAIVAVFAAVYFVFLKRP